jgi:hypothetical protein
VIPLIDSTKTTGLVFFPGPMVGMLLAGAAAVDAVRLQLVLLAVPLGGVSIRRSCRGRARLSRVLHRRAPAPRAGATRSSPRLIGATVMRAARWAVAG